MAFDKQNDPTRFMVSVEAHNFVGWGVGPTIEAARKIASEQWGKGYGTKSPKKFDREYIQEVSDDGSHYEEYEG